MCIALQKSEWKVLLYCACGTHILGTIFIWCISRICLSMVREIWSSIGVELIFFKFVENWTGLLAFVFICLLYIVTFFSTVMPRIWISWMRGSWTLVWQDQKLHGTVFMKKVPGSLLVDWHMIWLKVTSLLSSHSKCFKMMLLYIAFILSSLLKHFYCLFSLSILELELPYLNSVAPSLNKNTL